MPRSNPIQSSFNAGEISPRLHARLDFGKYANGLETCVNMIPLLEGGLARRSGTRYVAELADSSVKGNIFPFEASNTQAYILEFGEQTIRFFRNQGQITVSNTAAAITNGQFTSNIANWSDVSTGGGSIAHDATNKRLSLLPGGTATTDIGWAEQQVTNAAALTHVLKFRVLGAPGDSIQFRVGTSSGGTEILTDFTAEVGWHAYTFVSTAADFYIQFRNQGSVQNKTVQVDDVSLIDNTALSITSPYAEADLYQLNLVQSVDVAYIFHEDYATYKLARWANTSWSLIEVAWQNGPWEAMNATATTLTPAATTGLGVNVTANSVTGINGGLGWQSTDVGRLVRIDNPASGIDWGWGIIVSITSTTVAVVDIKGDFAATTADTRWRLGSWCSTLGFPKVGEFFDQRLFAANNDVKVQTFWASNTGDFENFAPDSANSSGAWDETVEDDDALEYTLSADSMHTIEWLSAGDDSISIGTRAGEWIPSSQGAVLTPTDMSVRQQTKRGSARILPVRVDDAVLFVQRGGRKVREFAYNFESDGYRAFDMTRLAAHISTGQITKIAFQQEPGDLLWATRTDGQLLSMTYRREEDVVGWARHILGGSFSTGDAVVDSVAVIPGTNGAGQVQDSTERDEVWVIVKRTINSATKRYIEVLERDYDDGHDQEDSYYSDSLITYDGASATSITGLDHLEGETVKVLADGYVVADKTVASGAITLTTAASVVQVGLGYTHTAKTLKLIAGTAQGSPIGQIKQIFGVTFVLLNSHTLSYGPSASNLKTEDFRKVSDAMDTAVPYFTGEWFRGWDDDWGTDPRMVVQSSDPVPFTLLALVAEVDTRESRG